MPTQESHTRLLEHLPALREYLQPRIPQRLRREIEVDDVLQDVLERVLKSHGPSRFSGICNMRAYLKTASSSVLFDRIRAFETIKRGGRDGKVKILHENDQTSFVNLFDMVSGKRPTPSSEAAMREAAKSIQLALIQIPKDQRTAVQLCHLAGLSYEEAGQKMGRSASSVHGLLDRGLSGLRAELRSAARFMSDAASDA
ncbi:MAG: hypothetical protein DHS20C16_22250 [Phycisphaerae bacterium]|nr:MAG: hypothetical protein DHS20C16_22250 [Phycisphaerae bacterium]